MQRSHLIALLIFLAGQISLYLFFTPFLDPQSAGIFHTKITFQGSLVMGRLLLYTAAVIAIAGITAVVDRYGDGKSFSSH